MALPTSEPAAAGVVAPGTRTTASKTRCKSEGQGAAVVGCHHAFIWHMTAVRGRRPPVMALCLLLAASAAAKPNVLFVVVDDLAPAFSSYG